MTLSGPAVRTVPLQRILQRRVPAAALAATALLFAACAPANGPSAATPATPADASASAASAGLDPALAGSRWRLKSGLAGVDADAVTITLGFEGTEAISGSGGCNQYRAELEIGVDGALRIGPAMATKRGCMGPANAAEPRWFEALEQVRSIVREGERVLLGLADGTTMVMVPHSDR